MMVAVESYPRGGLFMYKSVPHCPQCKSDDLMPKDQVYIKTQELWKQRYKCRNCGRTTQNPEFPGVVGFSQTHTVRSLIPTTRNARTVDATIFYPLQKPGQQVDPRHIVTMMGVVVFAILCTTLVLAGIPTLIAVSPIMKLAFCGFVVCLLMVVVKRLWQ